MVGKDVEHHQSVLDSTAAWDLVTENNLLAVVMRTCIEEECSGIPSRAVAHYCVERRGAAARLKDGPTSEAPRNFLHVFLSVATVDTERVQLHQLARVVFIYPATLLLWRRLSWHRLYYALVHQNISTSQFSFHATQDLTLTWS